jgi:Zn ribbon nucleic-acid-binding protein
MSSTAVSHQVGLTCPVCDGGQFKHELTLDNIECVHCGHVTTKQELIDANRPNIDAAVDDLKSEVIDEARKAFRKSLAGSKLFRLK